MSNGKRCLWTPCEYLGSKTVGVEKACWKIYSLLRKYQLIPIPYIYVIVERLNPNSERLVFMNVATGKSNVTSLTVKFE